VLIRLRNSEAAVDAEVRCYEAEAEIKFWPRGHFGLEDLKSQGAKWQVFPLGV